MALLEKQIVTTQNKNGNLEIIPVGSIPWSVDLVKGQEKPQIQGWYSKEYNKYEPNTASIYSAKINQSSSFAWVLFPSEKSSPAVQAKIISETKDIITIEVDNAQKGKWILKIPFSNSNDATIKFSKIKK